MSWEYDFIKLMKDKNKETEHTLLGKVTSLSPLSIAILEGQAIVSGKSLVISSRIQELVDNEKLFMSDSVCLLVMGKYSKFIAIDKVVM